MKRLLYILSAFLLITFNFVGCKKADQQAANNFQTFDAFIQSQPTLSTFAAALEKAQLQDFKTGPGAFTWFAPTNAAFTAAGILVDQLTPGQLSYILLYHLISNGGTNNTGLVTKKDMIAQNSFARTTQMGNSVFLGTSGDTSYVNGNSIISADNRVSNGIVHILNGLNIPPNLRGNIPSILTATNQNNLFITALTKANRLTLLSSTSVFTVLAPTDAAMTAAGYTTASINAASVGQIDSLVRYHLFSGSRFFTNDFANVTTQTTFLGTTGTLQTSSNGKKIIGRKNSSPVDIIVPNLLGTNGVVHVINGVLKY